MSLCPELSKISNPNLDLIDWLESIKKPERRCEIYLDVGIQLKRQGIPNKKITRTYLQLSEKPFVRLDKLTDDQIALFSYVGNEHTTAVSEDDEYDVVSDNNSSGTDNEIEEQQESNTIKRPDNVPVKDKELKKSDVAEKDIVEEFKDKGGFNSGEIQSCGSLAPLNALKDINLESTSVFDVPQIDKNDIAKETNYQESSLRLNALEKSNIKSSTVINGPQIDKNYISKETNSREGSPRLSALEGSSSKNTSVIDGPQIDKNNIPKEINAQKGSSRVSVLEESNVKSTSVIDGPQIDQSDIAKETTIQECLLSLNVLEDNNNRSAAVIDKLQIDHSDITEKASFQESLPLHKTLKDSNIKGSASKIITSQIDQSDVTEQTRFQESNLIQSVDSLAVADKLKSISVSERKSAIEELENNSLPTTTVDEILKVPSEKFNDFNKNKNLNNDQKLNRDINLNSFQIEEQLNDKSCAGKSLDEQLETKSSTMKNIKVTSLKKCDESKDIGNNGGLLNVSEKARTSNMKIKPTSNREELLCMQSLKEQIAKNLSKKNVHLPVSITNTLPILAGGKPVVSVQSAAKLIREKPLISVRKNLFEQSIETTLKCPEVSATQTNRTAMCGGNNNVSRDTNIGELSLTESSYKVKEHQQGKDGKSGLLSQSQKSNNFEDPKEGLKQLTAGLLHIKKIAESRKRSSLDSGDKIQAVKKRRLSEQISTSKGQEKQKLETDTENKSANKEQTTQKITIQFLLDSNVTHQTQTLDNSKTSVVNKPMLTQTLLKEGNKISVVNSTNQSVSLERVPRGPIIGSSESLSDCNIDNQKSQSLKTANVNAGNKLTSINSTHAVQEQTNKASSNMKMGQKTATERSINKSINNLIKRQSASVSGNNPLSGNQQTTEANNKLVVNSLTKDSDLFPENSTNISHVAASLEAAVKDKTDSSHSSENRLGSEFHTDPLNDQRSPQTTNLSTIGANQTAPATSTRQTIENKFSPDISRLVEKAIQQFLIYFCNRSDENLGSIPSQVRFSLNQYCINQRRPPFTRLTGYLKLYMLCYIKLFNNEEVRKRISKIAELLHLSIADFHRKNERTEQAKKLQSEVLRREEINRAKNDYDDILALRGRQFADLFLSVLSNINQVKGSEFLMLVTFYFKTTQALTKIDVENKKYVFSIKSLMKDLLLSATPALPLNCVPFFELELEDFRSNYCFVKQCLLTLYISGYFEAETETFWELIRHNPIIPALENIMAEFVSSRTQTVGSSGTTSTTVAGQMPSTLESLLRTCPRQTNTLQSPINVHQQTNAGTRNPFQFKNQLNIQNNLVPQRIQTGQQQQSSQRPSFIVRDGVPSQLPPFASLNQPHLSFQQMPQRNLPTSNIQATQGMYYYANHGVPQGANNSPSASSQPQLSRQFVRVAPKPYSYPPPPYPSTIPQQAGTSTNQLWQPGGSVGNTAPLNIRIPANNYQPAENTTIPPEEILSMAQICSVAGCSKLATLVCSLCREAVYCTTQCQAQDWYNKHSQACLK